MTIKRIAVTKKIFEQWDILNPPLFPITNCHFISITYVSESHKPQRWIIVSMMAIIAKRYHIRQTGMIKKPRNISVTLWINIMSFRLKIFFWLINACVWFKKKITKFSFQTLYEYCSTFFRWWTSIADKISPTNSVINFP